MRARIALLAAATTSAVVLAFVIPLCLLVRTLAEDRAMAAADQEARNVAILASTLLDSPQLPSLVEATDARGPARTSLLLPDGRVLGTPAADLAVDPDVVRARRGESFSTTDGRGGRVLLGIVVPDGTAVVRTVVPLAELHRGVTKAWLSIVALGLALLAVALLLADRMGRWISRPVREIGASAHLLREGDLSARAPVRGPGETQELASALNGLAERIGDLLASERAAVADLSHRLRTPVTALRLDAEQVDDDRLAERLQEHIAVLQRDIDTIVHEARRPVRQDLAPRTDLAAVVAERARYWGALADDQGRVLTCDLAAGPLVVAVAEPDVRDCVDVLLDNVFAHTGEDVPFTVRLGREGDRARLEVVDHGPGFARTSPPGDRLGSTGLGLDIVRRTARSAAGDLTVGATPGGGATVTLVLPLVDG